MRFRTCLFTGLAAFLASCGSDVSVPDDAKGTAETIISKLAENKPQVLWSALPESYQKDANEVARSAIASLDAEVYDKVVGILKKANKILTEKKEFILKNEQLGLLAKDMDEVSANWDAFTELVAILLDSQLGTYEKAKNIDLGGLLAETGSDLMGKFATISALADEDKWQTEFVAKLKAVKIEEASTSGEESLLQVTDPDGKVEEQTWVKVEGKWIPKEVKDGWMANIAKAKERIATQSAEKEQNKMGAMLVLGMVEGVLDQLDKASTQEDFEAAIEGLAKLGNFGD